MSDLMFYGVLRMPYEMAMSDALSQRQFYGRAQEAANRVEAADKRIAEQLVELDHAEQRIVELEEAATVKDAAPARAAPDVGALTGEQIADLIPLTATTAEFEDGTRKVLMTLTEIRQFISSITNMQYEAPVGALTDEQIMDIAEPFHDMDGVLFNEVKFARAILAAASKLAPEHNNLRGPLRAQDRQNCMAFAASLGLNRDAVAAVITAAASAAYVNGAQDMRRAPTAQPGERDDLLKECADWLDEHEKSMLSGRPFIWNALQCNELRWKVQGAMSAPAQGETGGAA